MARFRRGVDGQLLFDLTVGVDPKRCCQHGRPLRQECAACRSGARSKAAKRSGLLCGVPECWEPAAFDIRTFINDQQRGRMRCCKAHLGETQVRMESINVQIAANWRRAGQDVYGCRMSTSPVTP